MIKVLVVDDEMDICHFVKNFLEERGDISILTALNATEALRIVEKEKPQLILLDVMMRNSVDGIETLKRIRKMDKDVKVIMVSGVEDQDIMDRAGELGACGYLTKPLLLDELEKVIMSHVKKTGGLPKNG